MTHVLVPIDFSDCSHDVVQNAIGEAQSRGSHLVLLHVIQPPEGLAASDRVRSPDAKTETSVAQVLDDDARHRLESYIQTASTQGVQATARLEHGKAADAILSAARDIPADLIVIGTHGRAGLARLMLGSVSKSVSKNAPCPVMTVRTQYKPQCEARSCEWCDSHVTDLHRQLIAEQDG